MAVYWQRDGKLGTFAHFTLTVDMAVVQTHEVAHQRESDASAHSIHATIVAIEES